MLFRSEERLEKLGTRRDARVVDALVQATALRVETLADEAALRAQVDLMRAHIQARTPDMLNRFEVEFPADLEHHTQKLVVRTDINGGLRQSVFDHGFLSSPEYQELLGLRAAFTSLGGAPYTVRLGDDEVKVGSVQEVLAAVRKDAQKGLGLQRYKGLGEMNPEQLWETTMNPTTRTLLHILLNQKRRTQMKSLSSLSSL